MVQKMLPPNGRSASAVAEETGLPQPTLSRWLREVGKVGIMNIPARKWTLVEKLRVLLEASRVGESQLGELLRREGVHEAQLTAWRAEVETALGDGVTRGKRSASAATKRIKELERELRRKDRALAEAAAILVLKKKVAALWALLACSMPIFTSSFSIKNCFNFKFGLSSYVFKSAKSLSDNVLLSSPIFDKLSGLHFPPSPLTKQSIISPYLVEKG